MSDRLPGALGGTDDRGRTWRTGRLPVPDDAMVDLRAVGPRTLVAWYVSRSAPSSRYAAWIASTDGGATWREVVVRKVATLPAGWRVLERKPGPSDEPLLAVDPATGDIGQLTTRSTLQQSGYVAGLPASAGLWVSGRTGSRTGDGGRITWTGSAVEVSRDGGRTWRRHVFDAPLTASDDDFGAAALASSDGRTLYAVGRVAGRLVIYRSADGGLSWQRTPGTATVGERTIRAAVRPDGVLVVQAGLTAAERPLMFASTDGGRTLRPTTLGPGASAEPVPGGYVQTGGRTAGGLALHRRRRLVLGGPAAAVTPVAAPGAGRRREQRSHHHESCRRAGSVGRDPEGRLGGAQHRRPGRRRPDVGQRELQLRQHLRHVAAALCELR